MVIKFDIKNKGGKRIDQIREIIQKWVIIKSVDDKRIDFETRGMFSYFFIGQLFSFVDYGSICLKENTLEYKVVSFRYWLFVAPFFFITAVLPESYFFGSVATILFSIIKYFIIRVRHYLFVKEIVARK